VIARAHIVRATLAGAALLGLTSGLVALSVPSCQTYKPPPTAEIVGLSNGILKDPLAPIVVKFSTPVDPKTVSVEIAPFNIDAYGNLPDEVPDGGSLGAVLVHTPSSDTHTSSSWSADGTTLTLTPMPKAWLPIGPSLVMLILPGATSSTTGTVLHYRERLPFSYPAQCGTPQATHFQSGAYFLLLQVSEPLGVELKVFGAIDVNPQSGAFYGQFTAALRNSDGTRCSPACTGTTGFCETIPSEMCVTMSTPPVSVFEYPDFVPQVAAPNGYTFEMHGCATNQGDSGAVTILTAPGELNVTVPAVSIKGLTFTAQFVPVDGGAEMASGSLTATDTYLGMNELGPGAGTLTALSIPDAQAPANLPQVGSFASDAGDAASEAAAGGDAGTATGTSQGSGDGIPDEGTDGG
jgi:hypothetical protein